MPRREARLAHHGSTGAQLAGCRGLTQQEAEVLEVLMEVAIRWLKTALD